MKIMNGLLGKTSTGTAVRAGIVTVAAAGGLLVARNNQKKQEIQTANIYADNKSEHIQALAQIAKLGNPVPNMSHSFLPQPLNFSHNNIPMGTVMQ